jgi:hypothetical protein
MSVRGEREREGGRDEERDSFLRDDEIDDVKWNRKLVYGRHGN